MTKNQKKLAVLSILKQKKTPITLTELLQNLESGFAERTVRRWLNEWVNEQLIIKTGQKSGTRYQLVSEKPSDLFDISNLPAITYIRQPIFRRTPVTYNPLWLQAYSPNQTFYLSANDRKDMQTNGQRGADKNSAGTYARKIYNRLLIDLSYNSSRLEGNTYSLLDTEKLILEGKGAEGKLDAEKIMILNHKEAIRHLVDAASRIEIEFNEICTLHFLLSDALVPDKYAGKLRDYGVRTSASTYVPLENNQELEKLLGIITHKAQKIHDPFEASFFLLTHIAYLQAFVDVNKRTSRLSANIPLIKHNLVPLSFNNIDKEDYNSAILAIYELNDVEPLAQLYHDSYLRSCQQYDVNVEAVGYDEVRVRFRMQRREIISHIITQELLPPALNEYIHLKSLKIPEEYREHFVNNITEDLQEISLPRIAGLGISSEQLQKWLTIRNKKSGSFK